MQADRNGGSTGAPGGRRWAIAIPSLAAGILLFLMAMVRIDGGMGAYALVTKFWGFEGMSMPFLDTDTVLSALRCVRKGVDVFVVNPCDILGRVYDYSPLWLAASAFPVTDGWIVPMGFAVDCLYIASFLLLPVGRDRGAIAIIVLAVMSSASAYAVERGNNDLVIFALAALGAAAMSWSPRFRMIGYAAGLLAGLLKYYPMTLMALALRERPARFFAVAAASVVAVALFLLLEGRDLLRALALVPHGSFYGDMFGASQLSGGVTEMLDLPEPIRVASLAVMTAAAFWVGIVKGSRPALTRDLALLNEHERTFLFAGALLVVGCFVTAQSFGYRAITLIFVVPALTALSRDRSTRGYRALVAMTLALLWIGAIRQLAESAFAPLGDRPLAVAHVAAWLLKEALWWTVVTFLISCLTALIRSSTMMSWLGNLLPSRRPAGTLATRGT